MRSAGAMCACGARCGTDIVPGVETSFVSARAGGAGAVVVTPSVRLAEARDGVREVAFVAPSATAFHRRRGCRSVRPAARLSARTGRPNRDRFVATGRRSVAGGGRETRALRGTLPDRRDACAERGSRVSGSRRDRTGPAGSRLPRPRRHGGRFPSRLGSGPVGSDIGSVRSKPTFSIATRDASASPGQAQVGAAMAAALRRLARVRSVS